MGNKIPVYAGEDSVVVGDAEVIAEGLFVQIYLPTVKKLVPELTSIDQIHGLLISFLNEKPPATMREVAHQFFARAAENAKTSNGNLTNPQGEVSPKS